MTKSTLSRAHNLSGIPDYAGARRVIAISGRYTLIGCRLVTKISQVEIKSSEEF